MRVIINEALINRNKKISHVLFFASLAGMGIGFFYTWSQPASSNQISCLLLPVLLFMTLGAVRMANIWVREPRPITVLSESLKGLGRKYTVFHYLLPAHHVLVGPEGVFVIAAMWQENSYRAEGKKWYGDNTLSRRLLGYLRQDRVGNPFQEAQYQADQVQRLIDKIAPDSGVEVQPLIVFTNFKATLEIEDPIIPVLYADSKKKPSLRGYLKDQRMGERATLSLEAMDRLDQMYGLITRDQLEGLEAGDEDEEDIESSSASDDDGKQPGTVYILQAGSLYNIGMTRDAVELAVQSLQGEAGQDIQVVHTIDSNQPEKLTEFLHKKFARKRQKDQWFGLSKKDVTGLMSIKGSADSAQPQDSEA